MTNCSNELSVSELDIASDKVTRGIIEQLAVFAGQYPSACSQHNQYDLTGNTDWTTGFWSGMTWLAWKLSGSTQCLDHLHQQIFTFGERLELRHELETHDLGFLFSLSCVNSWRETGCEDSRRYALQAADLLTQRYHHNAQIIQAWGDLTDPAQQGRMIIDCLMNLPLLYWASEQTGNQEYARIATHHARQARRFLVREDYSTFHTFFMDVNSGEPIKGTTHQGYSDESCWARGQAWAIYGFALSYVYTGEREFLDTAIQVAHYFIDHLPQDHICYWDLMLDAPGTERDSSAAAIAICGLLELAKQLPVLDENHHRFNRAALSMMGALCREYLHHEQPEQGYLLHSVYNMNKQRGVDEYCIWGDYFFLEAIARLTTSTYKYW